MTKNLKNRFAVTAVLASLLAVLAVPAIAGAQNISPTEDQYDNIINIQGGGDTPSPDPASTSGGGTGDPPGEPSTGLSSNVGPLPFTGFDVIAMIAVALAVTGLGLGLRFAVSRDTKGIGA